MCKRINPYIGLCFLLSIFFFKVESSFAQTFGLNIDAGIVASQIDGDEQAGYDRPGPFLGLNAEIHLKSNMEVQVGIAYVFRGSQAELFPDNSIPQFKIGLQYIDIPVTFHYKDWLNEEGGFYRMDFFGGLYYGRLFSASSEFTPYDDVVDNFNKNEFGLTIGGSYNFTKNHAFGVKWCRALNFLYDPDKTVINQRSLLNRFLQFYYEYQF